MGGGHAGVCFARCGGPGLVDGILQDLRSADGGGWWEIQRWVCVCEMGFCQGQGRGQASLAAGPPILHCQHITRDASSRNLKEEHGPQ